MKPKKSPQKNRQQDLFRPELKKMIDPRHPLVKPAETVNWDRMDQLFGKTYCPDNGRPGVSTRLMVARHYLKSLLDIATRIHSPKKNDKNKAYSVHGNPFDGHTMNFRNLIGAVTELLRQLFFTFLCCQRTVMATGLL